MLPLIPKVGPPAVFSIYFPRMRGLTTVYWWIKVHWLRSVVRFCVISSVIDGNNKRKDINSE
jgi:hypothetical protein